MSSINKYQKNKGKKRKASTPAIPTKASLYLRRKARQVKLFSDEEKRSHKKALLAESPARFNMPCEDGQAEAGFNACSKTENKEYLIPKKDFVDLDNQVGFHRVKNEGGYSTIGRQFNHNGLKSEKEDFKEKKKRSNSKKYELGIRRIFRLKVQRKFAHTKSVQCCNTVPLFKIDKENYSSVDLYCEKRGATFTKMATCKFPLCQNCSPRLVERRQAFMSAGLQTAVKNKWPSFLVTNTQKRSSCVESQYIAGARGRGKICEKLDYQLTALRGLGYCYVVGIDQTIDERNVKGNYFHIHPHWCLVVYPLDSAVEVEDIISKDDLYSLLENTITKAWCSTTSGEPVGQDIQFIKDIDAAAGYIAKATGGGKEERFRKVSLEVAGSVYKKGKKGKSVPQLMDEIIYGSDDCIPLYQQIMSGTAGRSTYIPSRNWNALISDTLYGGVPLEMEEEEEYTGKPCLSLNPFWFDLIGAYRLPRVGLAIWKGMYLDETDTPLVELNELLDKQLEDLEEEYGVLSFSNRPPDNPLLWEAFVRDKGLFVWDGRVHFIDKSGEHNHLGVFEYAFEQWFNKYKDPLLEHSLKNLEDYLFDRAVFGRLDPSNRSFETEYS